MSERPTPETDAAERMAFAQEYMVPTAFARKLERERDEARELCRELSDLVAYGLGQHGSFWSLAAMRQATTAIQKTKQMGTLPTD